MKGHYRKKSKKALQVACLSACLVTAWAAPNYACGGSGEEPCAVPEPPSIALVAAGVAAAGVAAIFVHKKTSRKQ
jgi:hypothetical protein